MIKTLISISKLFINFFQRSFVALVFLFHAQSYPIVFPNSFCSKAVRFNLKTNGHDHLYIVKKFLEIWLIGNRFYILDEKAVRIAQLFYVTAEKIQRRK